MRATLVFLAWLLATPVFAADNVLLIQLLPGGQYKVWHTEGGKRITLGDWYVKAFITKLGVTATLWKAPAKP